MKTETRMRMRNATRIDNEIKWKRKTDSFCTTALTDIKTWPKGKDCFRPTQKCNINDRSRDLHRELNLRASHCNVSWDSYK